MCIISSFSFILILKCGFIQVLKEDIVTIGANRYFPPQHVQVVGLSSKPAMLSPTQPELNLDLTVTEPGKHILVINYVTPPDVNTSTNVMLTIDSEQFPQSGHAVLHPCPYTTACRQAIIDDQRRVAPFKLDKNYIKLTLKVRELKPSFFGFFDWFENFLSFLNFCFLHRQKELQMQLLIVLLLSH